MLLQLPDKGLALLDDTLTHWHTNARLLQQMMSWWLNAPPQNNEITLPNTFSQSLYDVLMHQRNLAGDKLRAMPPGRYVVAVGALHLYGEGICRRCCAKKWPISLLARQRGISFFYYYAVTLSDGVTRIVAQSHHPANTLRQDDSFLDRHQARLLFFLFKAENYHDTRS